MVVVVAVVCACKNVRILVLDLYVLILCAAYGFSFWDHYDLSNEFCRRHFIGRSVQYPYQLSCVENLYMCQTMMKTRLLIIY